MAVLRHVSLMDAPVEAIRCWAWGHQWEPGAVTERRDYGTTVWHCQAQCPCTRLRTDTINSKTGELFNREYGGGHGMDNRLPVERHAARLEWGRRMRAAQREARKQEEAVNVRSIGRSRKRGA